MRLKELCQLRGVSGDEKEVHDFLYDEYKNYLKKEAKSLQIKNLQAYNLSTLKNTYVLKNSVFFAIIKL